MINFKKHKKTGVELYLVTPNVTDYMYVNGSLFKVIWLYDKNTGTTPMYDKTWDLEDFSKLTMMDEWDHVKIIQGGYLGFKYPKCNFYYIVKPESVPFEFKKHVKNGYLRPKFSKFLKPETKKHFGDVMDNL